MKQYLDQQQTAKLIELWNIRKHNSITDISKTQYSIIVDVNMFLSAYTTESEGLIDVLFDMCVKLKEEGVI